MTDNVGLSTPRGSGTSGYIQRNLSALRPRQQQSSSDRGFSPYNKPSRDDLSDLQQQRYRQRQPDQEILEHERRRKVEVQVMELREKLEDEGVDEDDVDVQADALREKLLAQLAEGGGSGRDARGAGPKRHQVHELAEMKIQESERLRRALGIKEGYEEGGYWREKDERERERQKAGGGGGDRDKV